MKRNMDLVRSILLKVEESGNPKLRSVPAVDGSTQLEVVYHVDLLTQAGLVEATDASSNAGRAFIEIGLTWQGHEFLENVRDPEIWRKTKAGATKVGSLSIGVLVDVAKAVVAAKLKSLGLSD